MKSLLIYEDKYGIIIYPVLGEDCPPWSNHSCGKETSFIKVDTSDTVQTCILRTSTTNEESENRWE